MSWCETASQSSKIFPVLLAGNQTEIWRGSSAGMSGVELLLKFPDGLDQLVESGRSGEEHLLSRDRIVGLLAGGAV